ncbi:MAG TPA: glutamate-5-semialdehyde dehydrogenase [Phycisphaerales bacterium]|nr:glutamate-5-semialdehyde dehydrogenase [Phycisphaerales bacterium]
MSPVVQAAEQARAASRLLATLDTATKNRVLTDLARRIEGDAAAVLEANAQDLAAARSAGLSASRLQRLVLSKADVSQLSHRLSVIASLADPVGAVTRESATPTPAAGGGELRIRRVRAPLGVIAMIYEARPAVTIDAMALCFKAGNACILKGGKEADRTNRRLATIAHSALAAHDVPQTALAQITGGTRQELQELLTLKQFIDLVIPRGGKDLIEFVCENSLIPTVQHFQGVCHIYVDRAADLDAAVKVCLTAKTSAPATCNAAECILIHRDIAAAFTPALVARYLEAGVEVRADPGVIALAHAADAARLRPATPDDYGREFLDLIVAVRIVTGVEEAIEHIAAHGSNHTEAILTADAAAAEKFVNAVQSSCVLINASTRFNDGFQLGLGAEIGISTSRIHAYGPMGLEELTTQRWIVEGNGQTR